MKKFYQSAYRYIQSCFKPLSELLPSSGILVHPCLMDGKQCLIFENGLDDKDPDAYRYITNYARLNKLSLKEDQRNSFERVNNDRRKNVMPMMALGASLLFSKPVLASSIQDLLDDTPEVTTEVGSETLDNKQDEMIKKLLQWVGDNSSFNVDNEDLPNVLQVSSNEILETAYKGKLPKKFDAEKLQIFGLYNYSNKTIYLLDTVDLDSADGKAILIHELVHYLQYQYGNDQQVNCKNELERLAYLLEAEYLDDHGQRKPFSNKHIDRVSQCS
jgi:hypothetical protein